MHIVVCLRSKSLNHSTKVFCLLFGEQTTVLTNTLQSQPPLTAHPFVVRSTQVESQIKVRDLSHASVSFVPAEYSSWSEARSEIMVHAKRGAKHATAANLAHATGEAADKMRTDGDMAERSIENEIDHRPMEVNMSIDISYNFLSK